VLSNSVHMPSFSLLLTFCHRPTGSPNNAALASLCVFFFSPFTACEDVLVYPLGPLLTSFFSKPDKFVSFLIEPPSPAHAPTVFSSLDGGWSLPHKLRMWGLPLLQPPPLPLPTLQRDTISSFSERFPTLLVLVDSCLRRDCDPFFLSYIFNASDKKLCLVHATNFRAGGTIPLSA